jgi:hypothetical protein
MVFSQLLAYFNSVYPQALSWRLCHLRPALISTALWMQHCDSASLSADKPPPTPTGTSGPTFACNTNWTPTSPKDPMQCTGSKFSLSEYEQAGFPPPVTRSELTRWRTPSLTLARRIQWPTKETSPFTRFHGHRSPTLSNPQRLSQTRLRTIPVQVLHHASAIALLQNTALSLDAADLIWLAFFFLLRPGKYTITGTAPHTFTLADVRLWRHGTPIDPLTASPATLLSATFVILIFTDQKNAVRGKTVGHGHSGDLQACPVLAVVRRILHLRTFKAPPHTPLCALNAIGGSIPANAITALLRQGGLAFAIANKGSLPVLHQKALRPTGASALLSQGASYSTIKLLGRWKSDSALRYLHLQLRMSALAPSMLAALR